MSHREEEKGQRNSDEKNTTRSREELSPGLKSKFESVFDILRTMNYKGMGLPKFEWEKKEVDKCKLTHSNGKA